MDHSEPTGGDPQVEDFRFHRDQENQGHLPALQQGVATNQQLLLQDSEPNEQSVHRDRQGSDHGGSDRRLAGPLQTGEGDLQVSDPYAGCDKVREEALRGVQALSSLDQRHPQSQLEETALGQAH